MVWLAFIALVSVFAGNTLQAQERQELDSIVALVDDDIILKSELDLAIKGIIDRIRQQRAAICHLNICWKSRYSSA